MGKDKNNNGEENIRFIARHYKEGKLNTDKAWEAFRIRKEIRKVIPWGRIVTMAAAVLLLLVGFRSWYVWEQNRPEWIIISAEKGSVKNISLPDRSNITLAGGGEIRYNAKVFSKEEREIFLSGKAWFDIERNPSQPFTVNTFLSKVTVLGTSFELWDKGEEVHVYVTSGTVSFAVNNVEESVILTKGMSADYRAGQKEIDIDREENPNRLAWKNGQLIFDNTPLEQVIKDLGDYYDTEILNLSGEENVQLTASFNNLPMEDVLLIINQTLDTKLTPKQ